MTRQAPVMDASQVEVFLDSVFPERNAHGARFTIDEITADGARVRLHYDPRQLRPGGTISGPAMMTLTDLCMYAAILGHLGEVALAVTTSLNINFLRRPEPGDLLAEGKLLKLGKRLAVGEVAIASENGGDLVSHATATYSLPPIADGN